MNPLRPQAEAGWSRGSVALKTRATPGAVGDFPLYGSPGSLSSGSLAQAATRRPEPRVSNGSSPVTGGTVLSVTTKEASHPETSGQAAPGRWGRGAGVRALTIPGHMQMQPRIPKAFACFLNNFQICKRFWHLDWLLGILLPSKSSPSGMF